MFRTNLVLAILAVILAVPTVWALYQDRTVFIDYEDLPRLFEGFTRDNVHAVVVSTPRRNEQGELERGADGEVLRDALQLVRRAGEHWLIGGSSPLAGVPVPATVVYERVLQHFESIRKDSDALVQADASLDELGGFGLGADEAILIQCFDAQQPMPQPIAELYVGDDASRGEAGEDVVRGYFVRAKHDTDVVLYEQAIWLVDTDPSRWYERSPLRFGIDEAVELTIHNPKGHASFVRDDAMDPEWAAREAPAGVGAVRNGEVRGLAESVAALNVATWVAPLPQGEARESMLAEHGLAEPELWIEVALADGARHRLAFGKAVAGRNERYAQVSSLDFLLTVPEWVPGRFEKNPTGYFDPSGK